MTKAEARKVLSRVEETAEFVSQRVLDAIRVAITAIERSEVMDALDKVSGASGCEAFIQWLKNDVDECVCGGRMIKNEYVVLTSKPPKYIWTCASCGKVEERT